ncbi:hypothetical protein C8F04DRAFT_669436 [Mycena alexandri]|uniref:Uncharacterized protein n=1 Tax=Mycena alexandri TaxID=1745969 RepID=A0AAD6SQ86_9AGAR|nr:hypothetical protein C8F04DRAFT_669436 [Mycena alexandri]
MIPSVGLLIFLSLLFLCNGPSIHVRALVVSRPRHNAIVRRDPRSLAAASWIWPATSNGSASTSLGNAAFFKDFDSPSGKTASSAVITLTAVQNCTLWVNGQPIFASGGGQDGWKSAHVLKAALNESANTFSILVMAGNAVAPPPGLLVAIDISYTDSTNSTILSDASWLASRTIPSAFPSTEDLTALSHFAPAAVAGVYGSGPWGNSVSLPTPDPSPLTLQNSTWIWDSTNAATDADVALVGFRKTFLTPTGKRAVSAHILLTADNDFALHVNGQYQGAPPGSTGVSWQYAQQFTNVALNADTNVFTVIAQNFQEDPNANNPAGFIAAIKVIFADGTSTIISTDASWLNSQLGSLAIFLAADDSTLSPSIELGAFGIAPWGQLSGVSDVLSAASVPMAPFQSFSVPGAVANSATRTLPVGTIVAAVVGAVGGVLILVLLVTLLVCWRRRRDARPVDSEVVAFGTAGAPFSQYSTVPPSIIPATNYSPNVDPFKPETRLQPLRGRTLSARADGGQLEETRSQTGSELPPPSYSYGEYAEQDQSVAGSAGEAGEVGITSNKAFVRREKPMVF